MIFAKENKTKNVRYTDRNLEAPYIYIYNEAMYIVLYGDCSEKFCSIEELQKNN